MVGSGLHNDMPLAGVSKEVSFIPSKKKCCRASVALIVQKMNRQK
jgi:hypothetical protein